MTAVALDTSVAVPYLQEAHPSHSLVRHHVGNRNAVLTGHSLAECYSVLTRLPGSLWVAPTDAAELIAANFGPPALLSAATAARLPAELAPLGITGGAVYDALVALAAREADLSLVTRDGRAASTYRKLPARFDFVDDALDQGLPDQN